MDPFVKRYVTILSGLIFVVLAYLIASHDYRAGELNDLLHANDGLASYPYTFEVISLNNGVATLTTPRSASVPATKVLAVLFPALKHSDIMSPAMERAQKELAYIQSSAAQIVMAEEDVKKVVWQLDTRWLDNHGIQY